jgi:hypothetical protein
MLTAHHGRVDAHVTSWFVKRYVDIIIIVYCKVKDQKINITLLSKPILTIVFAHDQILRSQSLYLENTTKLLIGIHTIMCSEIVYTIMCSGVLLTGMTHTSQK